MYEKILLGDKISGDVLMHADETQVKTEIPFGSLALYVLCLRNLPISKALLTDLQIMSSTSGPQR